MKDLAFFFKLFFILLLFLFDMRYDESEEVNISECYET